MSTSWELQYHKLNLNSNVNKQMPALIMHGHIAIIQIVIVTSYWVLTVVVVIMETPYKVAVSESPVHFLISCLKLEA